MRRLPFVLFPLLAGCSDDEAPRTAPAARDASGGEHAGLTSTPLPERQAVDGTRFLRLDPAATGLSFTNVLRRENVVPYVYSGAGVAVGDYDQDGLPDVYLVSQDGPNVLWRQTAPMRFEDVTAAAGGLSGGDAWGTAAAFADVDGDGDLDLYVCNLEAPNLLYQNQGDGTFRECAGTFGLAIVAASTGCAFADYDNDGDLDLYLLTNRVFGPKLPRAIADETTPGKDTRKTIEQMFPPALRVDAQGRPVGPEGWQDFYAVLGGNTFAAAQEDRLLRNDGYARWTDVSKSAGIAGHGSGLSATWWDADGDGWLDLYVGNDLQSPDALYRNQRDGTFADVTRTALPHTAFFGMGADFGDVDNDGRLDFCVADMSSTTHYMGKMLMGSMGDQRWFLMNADPQQYMRNAVYVNSGTERFHEAAYLTGLASTDWTWTVRFVDLDEDGRLDLFATNGIPIFEDNPDLGAEFRRHWQAGRTEQALEIARNLPRVPERNVARQNLGDLQFADVGAEWGLDELSVAHGAAFADLDRDGDLDLVVNNQNQPASLFENRTAGPRRVLVSLRGTRSERWGTGARIELEAGGLLQTRLVVLARGYMSSGEAIEHFGLGDARRVDRLTVRWPGGAVQTFANLRVDHHHVVTEPAAAAAAPAAQPAAGAAPAATPASRTRVFAPDDRIDVRHRENDFDDYAVQPLLPHRLSRLGPGLAFGDVDGDGRDDVWIGGASGQAGTLLRAGPDGTFAAVAGPWRDDAACEDMGALFVDADSDGDLDLYVGSGGIDAIERPADLRDRLYVNDGTGAFARAAAGALPDLRIPTSCVCAADIDRDGDLDLFVGARVVPGRFPEAPPSVLLRNDGGRFVDATAEVAPGLAAAGMVSGATFADLDGDGAPDLAVAAQWQPLRVFWNDGAGRLGEREPTVAAFTALRGQWNGVAAGDLDGDGDLDLVATNLGLNSKYKAKPDHPLRLFANDYDGNGTFDVVEAKYQGEELLPVRGRSCSSEAMPFLAAKFPTYDAFARATLQEIYEPQQLARSLELSATELRHVVLENRGDGAFAVHPLPRFAQIAPAFGIAIADVDGDGGGPDIVLAQNSWSPEPETGRMDGGLGVVLRNAGGMRFEALRACDSGLVLPGDQKALALADLDGDGSPDLVATTNDGPVRTFAGSMPMLAVRLRGPAGNPTGIGARLELTLPNERAVVRTLQAGNGYLAQSPPVAFFPRPARIARLVVHWPDGQATSRDVPAGTTSLVIGR